MKYLLLVSHKIAFKANSQFLIYVISKYTSSVFVHQNEATLWSRQAFSLNTLFNINI